MSETDRLLESSIEDGAFPGASYAIWKNGELIQGATGHHTYDEDSPNVTLETVWDLASLSKVIGTTTAAMILVQERLLDLDQPVCSVIPEFGIHQKNKITFRNLMVHDSGLVAFRRYHENCTTASEVMNSFYKEELSYETGTDTIYSDLSMILVSEAIERVTGQRLDGFLKQRVFEPLGMMRSGFFRQAESTFISKVSRIECAPTETVEPWRTKMRLQRYGSDDSKKLFGKDPIYIQGEVHDPTATVLDGVAGHAGLFSTIGDLSNYLIQFMLGTQRIVGQEVWDLFTNRQDVKSTRALGWDTKSPKGSSAGRTFGEKSFGHTGYTGTSIWCDPEGMKFAILLTNRVHPTSENQKIIAVRPQFHSFC